MAITDNPVFVALRWIQNHWFAVAVYILTAAVLPSVVAKKERAKEKFRAEKSYAGRNCMYNLMGAAGAVFGLACGVIEDFGYLKYFYVDDLAPSFACISIWIAIVYQQGKRKKDREKNCSMVMVFFYALLQHELRYLYVTSLICIPVILISCVYSTTWLTLNREARFLQWIFMLVHSVIYMLPLFAREKLIRIRQYVNGDDTEHRRIRIGKQEIVLEKFFPLVFPLIVGIVYTLIWVMPSFIYRMQANEAYN